MTVVFSDNFNRADNVDPGANWSEDAGTWAIVTNALNGQAASSVVRTTTTAHSAIADMEVTVTQVDSAFDGGPIARKAAAALTYYEIDCYTGTIELWRYVAGAGTLVASDTITLTAGSVIIFRVTGTGATVSFTVTYNGTGKLVGTTDTNASRIVAAGFAGCKTYTTNDSFDDFSLDDLAVAGGDPKFGMSELMQFANVMQQY